MTFLSTLLEKEGMYDLFFVDLWGVTHNGKKPFPGAIDFFKRARVKGKFVYLLSNAPRMPQIAAVRLDEMGILPSFYQNIYTSGADCHSHLKDRPDGFYQHLGTKLFHIGPERDRNLFDSLAYQEVDSIDAADFLLITGTDQWDRQIKDYVPVLEQALERDLPAICANPDKYVLHGDEQVICCGLIATHYAEMGGNVRFHGKPDASIFQKLHKFAENELNRSFEKQKILMIGDSLATDIAGANAYGIDSLLVLTGLHGDTIRSFTAAEQVIDFCNTYQAHPTYIASGLA